MILSVVNISNSVCRYNETGLGGIRIIHPAHLLIGCQKDNPLVLVAIIVVSGVEFSSSSKLQNYVHYTVHNSPLKPATLHHHTETHVYLGIVTSLKPKLLLFYTTIALG
ncbi:hypothetical protein H5410_062398 [Solanum commersonii]|uniref:Uncharacterized protein n=1 Tax=Solanum commersonii TaxID=4109 RepID=A0A9J5WC70_SOLCO|nr:hypothetical protein H5410_062398 [Solanum commersonii]